MTSHRDVAWRVAQVFAGLDQPSWERLAKKIGVDLKNICYDRHVLLLITDITSVQAHETRRSITTLSAWFDVLSTSNTGVTFDVGGGDDTIHAVDLGIAQEMLSNATHEKRVVVVIYACGTVVNFYHTKPITTD